jgi:hypothetical protein
MSFIHPFTCLVAGSTGSGKTILVRDVLSHHDKTITGLPHGRLRVLWCFGIDQKVYHETLANVDVTYHEGLISESDLKQNEYDVIVVDDLMTEKANDTGLCSLFTRGSHHLGISIIFIVQNLFARGSVMRTISLNSQIIILLRNPRDKSQVATFGRQVFPGQSKYFLESYEDATKECFGYLVIDLSPHCEDKLRLKSNIIPRKGIFSPVVYLPR